MCSTVGSIRHKGTEVNQNVQSVSKIHLVYQNVGNLTFFLHRTCKSQ